ncbi:MAG: hypothetical protein K8F91_19505, partial [Candidatus Obscuribacterales bacterium]|nr:hypothetical protein [Candidatus Obscuribacterales bacterium]
MCRLKPSSLRLLGEDKFRLFTYVRKPNGEATAIYATTGLRAQRVLLYKAKEVVFPFKCTKPVEYFWVLGDYLAFEGSPIW